jgi:hypothetical protein
VNRSCFAFLRILSDTERLAIKNIAQRAGIRIVRMENTAVCEYCNKTDVTVNKLDSDEESPCEWFTEEERPGSCDKIAVYSVSEWYVEDHLCDAHKKETEKELEEGLADFLDSVGFGSQFEIRPIRQDETCDYIAPSATDWKPCGKKATHAKYTLENWSVCAEHAAEMGSETHEK